MQFHINWIENKSPDWRIANVTDLAGVETKDVSINRVNKKGEVFPNWEGVTLEATIEADLWVSTSGKVYLFAPRPQNAPKKGGFNVGAIKEAQTVKREDIQDAQKRKDHSIKVSGAMRDAILIVTTFGTNDWTEEKIQSEITKWRNWILKEHENVEPF